MARKFLTPVTLPTLATDPASPETGTMYYNTVNNVIKVYNGDAWMNVGGGVSAALGILDHTHDYEGNIFSVSYATMVEQNKFFADGGSATTETFSVTWDGGNASGS